MSKEENPFAPSWAASAPAPVAAPAAGPPAGNTADDSNPARIRSAHLRHETSCRQVAWLYYSVSALVLLATATISAVHVTLTPHSKWSSISFSATMVTGGVALLLIAVAWGLQTLEPRVRIPVAMISLFNLFACVWLIGISMVVGLVTIIILIPVNVYIAYLMLSDKGNMVFSRHYAEIRSQTPDIKFHSTMAARLVGAMLMLVIALSVVGVVGLALIGPRV